MAAGCTARRGRKPTASLRGRHRRAVGLHRRDLQQSTGKALNADRLKTAGGVFLSDGFRAEGEVRLLGADIGGNLECTGATFSNPKGEALSADGLKVKGSVLLCDGFHAEGEVRLLGADIGGNLECINATFNNPKGDALSAEGMQVNGSPVLARPER